GRSGANRFAASPTATDIRRAPSGIASLPPGVGGSSRTCVRRIGRPAAIACRASSASRRNRSRLVPRSGAYRTMGILPARALVAPKSVPPVATLAGGTDIAVFRCRGACVWCESVEKLRAPGVVDRFGGGGVAGSAEGRRGVRADPGIGAERDPGARRGVRVSSLDETSADIDVGAEEPVSKASEGGNNTETGGGPSWGDAPAAAARPVAAASDAADEREAC